MTPLLELHDVAVARGRRTIVEDVSFSLARGEILAVVGPNGSGKSTLLKAVTGLLPLARGEVRLGDRLITDLSGRDRASRIAYVPQQSALEAALPVDVVVAQGRFAHVSAMGRVSGSDRRAVELAMEQADVMALRHRTYNQLSYGERRRVLLARALATDAPVLLLDEPTAALDVRHVLLLFQILERLAASGKAIVVVLHQLLEVLDVATCTLLLNEGRVVRLGRTDEVIGPESTAAVYGVDLVPGKFWYRLQDQGIG